MSEQTREKKNKFINFKPGIRKDVFKVIVFMGIFMVIMLVGMRLFGRNNGMAFGMAVMGILMTLTVDMTLEPAKNIIKMTAGNAFMVFMSFLGYALFPEDTTGRIVMYTVSTFVTFFTAIYFFSSEEYGSVYMPMLLSFSLLLYYNGNTTSPSAVGQTSAPGSINIISEMLVRMAIYAGAGLLSVLVNFLIHGRKFTKKIKESIDNGIKETRSFISDIYEGNKTPDELTAKSDGIDKLLSGIEASCGTKMTVHFNKKTGHDLIRTVTILKRINKTAAKNYINDDASMTDEIYEMLNDMLVSIERYENDEINADEISAEFDRLYQKMNIDTDHDAVIDSFRSEMDDFIEGEVRNEDREEKKSGAKEKIFSHANIYTFIFALKTAALAAAGVLVVSIFRLPMGYMFPLYVGITAQPYLELTKGNVKKRIINTLYAVGIILVSFSITDTTWVHILLLVVITLVADMFFQFDYMTMMGSMMAIVINVIIQPDLLYSYSFYRLGYIAAACVAIQVVDMFIFPRNISESVSRQMEQSIFINDKLREAVADDSCDYKRIQAFISEKRTANQRLRNTNRYAKNEDVTNYLLSDEEWLNRLSMISHRLKETSASLGDIRRLIDERGTGTQLTPRQHNILTSFDEVLEDIAAVGVN